MSANQLAGSKWKFEQRTIYVWIRLHLNLLEVLRTFKYVGDFITLQCLKVFMSKVEKFLCCILKYDYLVYYQGKQRMAVIFGVRHHL